jgi:hypothetical protein
MERRACSPRRRGGVWRRCGGGLLRLLAMKGKKLDEFATGWSFFRNRRMDLRLTGGIESTATVAATLFMVAGKIKIAAARGSSVDEVLSVRGRMMVCSHFWFWSRMGSDKTGYRRGARGGGNGGRKRAQFGGGGGREGRELSVVGRGALM